MLFVILLLIVNITGTIIPCCPADGCSNENSALNDRHPEENEDKGNCSPFFACGTCAHAIEIISPVSMTLPESPVLTTYCRFYLSELSTYHPSLFQPPRFS
jgi:hypothetical protein